VPKILVNYTNWNEKEIKVEISYILINYVNFCEVYDLA